MNKTFCIAGPVVASKHYCLSLRLNSQELHRLIDEEKYFILHAPRQTGKTTAILNFVQQLNSEGKYIALYINIEPAQAARNDISAGLRSIFSECKGWIRQILGSDSPLYPLILEFSELQNPSGGALGDFLRQASEALSSPLILFVDEIDSLVGDTLISVLRQLRSGYVARPRFFPQSVCLMGVRDVRDYRIWSPEQGVFVLGGSAFNIKAKSLTLANFSPAEVAALYQQHTDATGQAFTPEAIEYAFYLTQGQPWLVNALAQEACFELVTDRSQSITKEVIDRAKEVLILRRDTHLDVLIDRLSEERVRRIIQMIILGEGEGANVSTDDLSYVRDLGLVTQKGMAIANPIYQEIIPRELSLVQQAKLEGLVDRRPFIRADGSLDMRLLLEKFGQFYREQSSAWIEVLEFKEIGPHILLLAFLQRIINGGGSIHREYALGRKRVDLLVVWKNQRIVIELKIRRGEKSVEEGLVQTAGYMGTSQATEGHLVVFDQSPEKSWDEKIFTRQEDVEGKTIAVWGL
jgi:hypothetical protein